MDDKEVLERLEERIAKLLTRNTDDDGEYAFAVAVNLTGTAVALRQAIAQESMAREVKRIADQIDQQDAPGLDPAAWIAFEREAD
jgi:hypothetical protein